MTTAVNNTTDSVRTDEIANKKSQSYITFDKSNGDMTIGNIRLNPIKVHTRDLNAVKLAAKAAKAKDGDEPNDPVARVRQQALAMLDTAVGILARTDQDSGSYDPKFLDRLTGTW